MRINLFLFLIFCFLSGSCTNRHSQLEKEILKLQSKPVFIPYDALYNVYRQGGCDSLKGSYRLVVFTDSLSCSSCALKHLVDWIPLLDSVNTLGGNVNLLFIFDPPHNARHTFKHRLGSISGFPIYLDTCHAFIKCNPHIPDNSSFRVFMIDRKDSVVLVGNPLSNYEIQRIFFNLIKLNK